MPPPAHRRLDVAGTRALGAIFPKESDMRFSHKILGGACAALGLISSTGLAQKPDLQIASFECPSVWKAGDYMTFKALIANKGNAISAPCKAGFYRSVNSTISGADTLLFSRNVPTLVVNSAYLAKYTTLASTKLTDANYYYGVKADREGIVSESNEFNNTASKRVAHQALPDLRVTDVTIQSAMRAGDPYQIKVEYENAGAAPSASCRLGLVSSEDANVRFTDRFVTSVPVKALVPNETGVAVFAYDTSKRWPRSFSGLQYVGAVIDIGSEVEEGSYANDGKGVLRNVPSFNGSGAYLEYKNPYYQSGYGAYTTTAAKYGSWGGSDDIALVAPQMPFHSYVLVWSLKSSFELDWTTEFGLGLLGTPMMTGYFGKTDGLGNATATFKMPAGFNGNFYNYTHSVWFDSQFTQFVGMGANALRSSY